MRRKHNVGHPVRTQWVFGGLDTETQDGFLVALDRRDADTLLPILQEYVLPQTTVVSDLWGAYRTINNLGNQHLTVNHRLHFVDPVEVFLVGPHRGAVVPDALKLFCAHCVVVVLDRDEVLRT